MSYTARRDMRLRVAFVTSAIGLLAIAGSAKLASASASAGRKTRRAVESADPFSTSAMRTYLAKRTGSITAAVYDVSSGATYLYRPGIAEQTASIIKVTILATLLHEAESAHRNLDDTEQDEATDMIEYSDNDDANALWYEVGGASAIARVCAAAGLTATRPNTEGYWGETTTTAADQLLVLRHLALANPLLSPAARSYELGLMEHVVSYERWGVSDGVPPSATVALKNGWLPLSGSDWQINSIGYVHGTSAQYLLAILTTGDPTEGYGIATTDEISHLVWNTLS